MPAAWSAPSRSGAGLAGYSGGSQRTGRHPATAPPVARLAPSAVDAHARPRRSEEARRSRRSAEVTPSAPSTGLSACRRTCGDSRAGQLRAWSRGGAAAASRGERRGKGRGAIAVSFSSAIQAPVAAARVPRRRWDYHRRANGSGSGRLRLRAIRRALARAAPREQRDAARRLRVAALIALARPGAPSRHSQVGGGIARGTMRAGSAALQNDTSPAGAGGRGALARAGSDSDPAARLLFCGAPGVPAMQRGMAHAQPDGRRGAC